jgi:hypothetical protein
VLLRCFANKFLVRVLSDIVSRAATKTRVLLLQRNVALLQTKASIDRDMLEIDITVKQGKSLNHWQRIIRAVLPPETPSTSLGD